jgi:chromosome segregation ATPase
VWTGRETLKSIESSISKLYREETELDGSLKSAVAQTERLRKERADAMRELARVKLDEMAAGRLVNNLDAGERRAVRILDDYRLRIANVTERRERLVKELEGAQADRDVAAKRVEEALAAVEAVRAEAERKVQGLPNWRAAKAASDAANAIAGEAEKKAASSDTELGAKRKPYDDDPLFVYLWSRGFGTGRYRSSGVVRFMDRMVADFVDFGNVRPNYAALIEIPLRLREHATAKRSAADEKLAALSVIERKAMVDAGIEPKERALNEARHSLAASETTLDEKHGLLQKLDAEHNALVGGGAVTNPAYEEALVTIAAADAIDETAALYLEARRTPTDADDAIVRQLESIDSAIGKADKEVAELRRTARDLAKRRTEVERVRDRFRGAGYDHPHGTFGNDGAIRDALGRTVAGTIAGQILWEILQGGYSTRGPSGRPDFGYPTSPFPFPIPGGGNTGPWGGEWRDPSSRGGWSPDGGGGGGDSSGGGDFSTGGSF